MIATHLLADIVQAAVGVFLHAAKISEVILDMVVVAYAKQAHANRHILKYESAKIRNKRLNTDTY